MKVFASFRINRYTKSMVAFDWQRETQAEEIVLALLKVAVEENIWLREFTSDLHRECSTGLLEWVDHITLSIGQEGAKNIERAGFKILHTRKNYQICRHPQAKLPDLVIKENQEEVGVAIGVDSIPTFLEVRGMHRPIEGAPYSAFRRALLEDEKGIKIWVVERRGSELIDPSYPPVESFYSYFEAKERWMTRPRSSEDEESDLEWAIKIADEIARRLGEDLAACLVLECERNYWQSRNTAGQIQKNRQDRLGLGWANHDHHTFRSSRRHFHQLVKLFEILGFYCRERYYAGQEAGWGAQIMENPKAKLVLFLDVDLSGEELSIDFAHDELQNRRELGTIGLWCALHGDSILKAGMHHLEAQFDFEQLAKDLKKLGVSMMQPFSNFPYLKQAFTEGEFWPVEERRIDMLFKNGQITEEEAKKFREQGALGSHLENLQRKEGYKGFNQKNVSLIIKKTDPRLAHTSQAP